MNGLKSLVVLQARVYGFLAQQDEATLQAIVDGTVGLAAVRPGDVAPVAVTHLPPIDHGTVAADDPSRAARAITSMTSEQERLIYLNTSRFTVNGLRRIAKALGIRGYSALRRDALIGLLSRFRPGSTGYTAAGPDAPQRAAARPDGVAPPAPRRATDDTPRTSAPRSDVDVAAIAARLREIETEDDGATYLHAQRLDRETLLAVATELQLTRVDRLAQAELEKRVLRQAIGARRRFAGLRKW